MTDSTHSMNLRGARPGVSITQLRRRGALHKSCLKPGATKMARGKVFNPTKFGPIEDCSGLAPAFAHVRARQLNNVDVTSISRHFTRCLVCISGR